MATGAPHRQGEATFAKSWFGTVLRVSLDCACMSVRVCQLFCICARGRQGGWRRNTARRWAEGLRLRRPDATHARRSTLRPPRAFVKRSSRNLELANSGAIRRRRAARQRPWPKAEQAAGRTRDETRGRRAAPLERPRSGLAGAARSTSRPRAEVHPSDEFYLRARLEVLLPSEERAYLHVPTWPGGGRCAAGPGGGVAEARSDDRVCLHGLKGDRWARWVRGTGGRRWARLPAHGPGER